MYREYARGYYVPRSVEAAAKLTAQPAIPKSNFTLTPVEGVMIRDDNISGLIINESPAARAGLHADPMILACRFPVDRT